MARTDCGKWNGHMQRRMIIGDSLLMPTSNNHNILSTSSSSTNNSTIDTSTTSSSPASPPAAMVQQQQLKCPRCESSNTKFCYYNNYSLSQPRHFCKACRRYWTRGGTLRSVPVGGGCRKNKRAVMKKATPTAAAAAAASSASPLSTLPAATTTDHLNSLFYGLPPAAVLPPSNMNLACTSGFPTLPQMYDLQPQMSALGIGFSSGRRHDEEISQMGFGACSLADLQQQSGCFLNNYQPSFDQPLNILEAGGQRSFELPKQVKAEGENNVVRGNINGAGMERQDQAPNYDMNASGSVCSGDSSFLYWSSPIFGGAGWPDIANSCIAPMI